MNANVGGIDKILRITAGIGLIGATVTGLIGPWGFLGIVPLVTGMVGWCPFYPLLGMNTCPAKKSF